MGNSIYEKKIHYFLSLTKYIFDCFFQILQKNREQQRNLKSVHMIQT